MDERKKATEGCGAGASPEAAREKSLQPGPEDEELNDDERDRFNWASRYEDEAWKKIRVESIYVVVVVVLALVGLYFTWHGLAPRLLSYGCVDCSPIVLKRYLYVFLGGLLGGGLFGLKYLYKVVARGWWNQDRVIWRFASPLLSAGLAFAAGAFFSAGILGFSSARDDSSSAFVALGFIVGYFADRASGKMQEIAETMFGTHTSRKSSPRDGKDSQ